MRALVHLAICSATLASLAGCAHPVTQSAPSLNPSGTEPTPLSSATPTLPAGTRTPPPWLAHVQATQTAEVESYLFTSTPVLTATTDPRPLATSGPWILFATDEGLWVTDSAGSSVKSLVLFPPDRRYGMSVQGAPTDPLIAYADPAGPDEYLQPYDGPIPSLHLVKLPSLESSEVSPLASRAVFDNIIHQYPSEVMPEESTAWYKIEQIRAAIARSGSIAWSPDASALAFSAALHGESSDLYTMDLRQSRLTRLTSGLTQATNLQWSPDGRYIIHYAVSDINIGRSGTDIIEGLWAADTAGGAPRLLTPGTAIPLAWIAPHKLLVHYWHIMCDEFDLELIDVANGNRIPILRGVFQEVAVDPVSGTAIVGNEVEIPSDEPVCPASLPPGLFIVTADGSPPSRVGDFAGDYRTRSIRWSAALQSFVVTDNSGMRYVSLSGEVSPNVPEGRQAPLESFYRNPDYCDIVPTHDMTAVALSTDTALYVASPPLFQPQPILTNLNGLCRNRLQWVYPQ